MGAMKGIVLAICFFLSAFFGSTFAYYHFSDNDDGFRHGRDGINGGHKIHAAPGPIAGAGLPALTIGYGVYWLVKRRRRKNNEDLKI